LIAKAIAALLLVACASAAPPAEKLSMKTYQLALLRRGPSWSAEKTPERAKLLDGHMANIRRLAGMRKLLIAGPIDVGPDAPRDAIVGIFIFDVATKEEAEALAATDPTITSGHFSAQVMAWYGPAGLTYAGHDEVVREAAASDK